MSVYKKRQIITAIISLIFFGYLVVANTPTDNGAVISANDKKLDIKTSLVIESLNQLSIKGRAPKTDYSREKFGASWTVNGGCDTRNIILNRDLKNVTINSKCEVISGTLIDPYSGKTIEFFRGSDTSGLVQIDHVVALSDAWQKGAQQMTLAQRVSLANDPLELLAVDGSINLQKSDGDAATWLLPNKPFRCQYVARQVAVKQKYGLWVTQAEYDAITRILETCPNQQLPAP